MPGIDLLYNYALQLCTKPLYFADDTLHTAPIQHQASMFQVGAPAMFTLLYHPYTCFQFRHKQRHRFQANVNAVQEMIEPKKSECRVSQTPEQAAPKAPLNRRSLMPLTHTKHIPEKAPCYDATQTCSLCRHPLPRNRAVKSGPVQINKSRRLLLGFLVLVV